MMQNNFDFNHLLRRGVAEVIVEEEFIARLKNGDKLRLKEGFDPSSSDIHLGHMVGLRKLRQFQELGHEVVLIVGDWTAQIGDPTGQSVTRPVLSYEQVKSNAETYMQQFFKIVDRSRTEVRWQSEWFGEFSLADVLKLTGRFTIAQFLAREDFNKRFTAGKPITLTEFIYPLLQAYDSVQIQAGVEFGGTDQKFNLLVGRELQGMVGQQPQQVLMTPLLVGTDGAHKMSKSLGNYIGITEAPAQIFGKVMSVPDNLLMDYFTLVTDVPDAELAEFRTEIENGANPMALKKRLAREIISQLYDKSAATAAEDNFVRIVQNKETPAEIPEFRIIPGTLSIPGVMLDAGLVKSKGEAMRLIQQGGVEIDGNKITEPNYPVANGAVLKAGKRRYVMLVE
ncbi:MAG: tyrosine--tRNA ligase [Dehalococcoidia bacterium]|nr:tyrosine--tRNA ligase [Dehalococcoidia bacterium]